VILIKDHGSYMYLNCSL